MALAPGRLDHRFAVAVEASEFSQTEAQYRLRSADSVTRRAYQFKCAVDAGLDTGPWPDITAAYELFSNRPSERTFIEGLLLTGAPNPMVANLVGCDPEDVQAFHDLFFDVRARLDKPGWIVAQLFEGALYSNVNSRDKVGQLHRVAWLGGPDVFLAFYSSASDPMTRKAIQEIQAGILTKCSLLASMNLVGRDEINVDLVRITLEAAKEDVAAAVAGGDEEVAQTMLSFIKSVPLLVADPTVEANLSLPAREKRAHEYLVTKVEAPDVDPHD
jgi:hypothetical protein